MNLTVAVWSYALKPVVNRVYRPTIKLSAVGFLFTGGAGSLEGFQLPP
ncbi:MAG TPA: hypothetical protein VGO27_04940 [Candidatus Acidoferrum sp.]|nr:hypothetical protein [Candidatus Acidoferrum sp.]